MDVSRLLATRLADLSEAGTDTAPGVLPARSTNVFACTVGMTNDPIEATGEFISASPASTGPPLQHRARIGQRPFYALGDA